MTKGRKSKWVIGFILLAILSGLSLFADQVSAYVGSFEGRGFIKYSYITGNESITSIVFELPEDIADALMPEEVGGWTVKKSGNKLILSDGVLEPGESVIIRYYFTRYVNPGTKSFTYVASTSGGQSIAGSASMTINETIILKILAILKTLQIPLIGCLGLLLAYPVVKRVPTLFQKAPPHKEKREEKVKVAPCEEIARKLEQKRKEVEWKRKHMTAPIGEWDRLFDKALKELSDLEEKYIDCLTNNCNYEKLEELLKEKVGELGKEPRSKEDLKEAEKEVRVAQTMVHSYEINIKAGNISTNDPGYKEAKKRLEKVERRKKLIAQVLDLRERIAVCKKKRMEIEEEARRRREECEKLKKKCIEEVERLKEEIKELRQGALKELSNLADRADKLDGRELWTEWWKSFNAFRDAIRRFEPVLKLANLKMENYRGLWDWGGPIGTAVGYAAEDIAKITIPTYLIDVVAETYQALSGFFDKNKQGAIKSLYEYEGDIDKALDIIEGVEEFPNTLKDAFNTFKHCLKNFKELEDKIDELVSKRKHCLNTLPNYPSEVDIGECIEGCEKAKAKLMQEKKEVENKVRRCREKTKELEELLRKAEDCKTRIKWSINKMNKAKICLDRFRRGTAKFFELDK